ncbi:unnamed protein product [Calicophoron daubneyi]|uniref:dolichyl-P-Man:Man5GlcNAc2-PP-dolichol alpha-1,3-mannosyltransferase n=1 Tax=Calicophoron daubneyi TaxID=300641 RepID=A0AAV2T0S0_CALDB
MTAAFDVVRALLFSAKGFVPVSFVLLIGESLLCTFIINNVKYTEIDWVAYMQEVESYLNGSLDYDKIEGQTGPCVYPAGFIYIFALLRWATGSGTDIRTAQFIFLAFYFVTLLLVFNICRLSLKVPPYALIFSCLISYRVHSIYVLRLFNDPVAMIAVYSAINALLYGWFDLGCILFSLGVSIKMNVLLFAPGLLLVLLLHRGVWETVGYLCECATVQLVLGAPFLFHNAGAYLSRAFNFGRQFLYQWTVNWRLIPEHVFLDRRFHLTLLSLHIVFLVILLYKFIRSRGGIGRFACLFNPKRVPAADPSSILYPLFVSNLVGITFSRSLHYQFYVWYFHTLVYLFWCVDCFSVPVKLLLLGLIEICWNTYPSTVYSSGLLHFCHLALLFGLLVSGVPSAAKPKRDASGAVEKPTAVAPTSKTAAKKRQRTKAKLA